MKTNLIFHQRNLLLLILFLFGCSSLQEKPVVIYLIGDSTVADYADNYEEGKDYYKTRYPVTGWGQVFQEQFTGTDLTDFKNIFDSDSVIIDDRARGGRSTRTFFQEGRWRSVCENLKKGDVVIMQFGHNDGAQNKPERYTDIESYKEFLRLFISQTREKNAVPIILTPVCRNYPWKNSHLENVHGEYPKAALDVAVEMQVCFIDLNQLSMDTFSGKGQEYVTNNYFMNLPSGVYEAYPEGQSDNTHFQPEGAKVVAELVFNAMKIVKK
ncbi:MAG: rhamnogalacturonan acetylesterase [Marinifilaceae bacterium]|nr:rhamnogalacturonan acetylesterase [Marinifilaceae bacterium]